MKTHNRKAGYSVNTANEYIDSNKAIFCLSTELIPQIKFEDGKSTGEIISYKAWFSQEGLPPFQVKFKSVISLPHYLSVVELENLEACEVNNNVYFRANKIKEIK